MKKANIIWFIVDQMYGQAMGVNGDPNVFTPNLAFHSGHRHKRDEMLALLQHWAHQIGDEFFFPSHG